MNCKKFFLKIFNILIFAVFFIKNTSSENLEQKSLKSDDIFIESKFSSINENFSTFEKDVITLKSDLLLNSDELNYVKISLYKDVLKKEKDNDFMLEINSDFKSLFDDGTFVYGKFLNHNKKEAISFGRKVQIFLPTDSGSLFGDLIVKTEDGYIIKNCFFSSCTLSEDNLEKQRIEMLKNGFYNIKEVAEPDQKVITRDSEEDVKDSYSFKPWLVRAKEMYIDKIENRVYMKHAWVRFFGIPVMYSPSFSFPLGKEGQSGLMIPRIVLIGGPMGQQGIEIPFYFRLANNMDFIVSRSQYFTTFGKPYSKTHPGIAPDFGHFRASTTNFTIRHLLSDKYRFMSYYKAEGIMTDKTILIDRYGATSVDASGNPIYGLRGTFNFYGELALSNNIFTKLDFLWTSDINFLYIYRMTYLPYKKNYFEFRYTDERQNHSIELINYITPSLFLPSSFNSTYMPVIRSHVDFTKDGIKGNFYYDFYSDFINKSGVLRNFNARLRTGYHLSHLFNHGSRIVFDVANYLQYDNVSLSSYNDGGTAYPGVAYTNSTLPVALQNINYILGSYSYLLNSQIFGNPVGGNFFISGINSKVQLEHDFFFHFKTGTLKIKPILALRYNQPFTLNNLYNLVNISGMSTMMDATNMFNFNRIQALSIFEYGSSVTSGFNIFYSFKNTFNMDLTIAYERRFFNGFMPNYQMLNFVGLANSSNLFLSLNMKLFGFNYQANARISTITGQILQIDHMFFAMILFDRIRFAIGHMYLTPQATFINRSLNMFFVSCDLKVIKRLFLMTMFAWDFAHNPTYFYQTGITSTMSSYTVGLLYRADCYEAGIFIARSYVTPVGVPSIITYAVRFKIIPKFDTDISPGGRQLPTRALGLSDL